MLIKCVGEPDSSIYNEVFTDAVIQMSFKTIEGINTRK